MSMDNNAEGGRLTALGAGAERRRSEGLLGDRVRFARDVLVNLVANLLAAAIIYLLGVLFGLLPSSVWAVALSLFVAISAVLWVVRLSSRARSESARRSIAVWEMLIGLGLALAAGPNIETVEVEWRPAATVLFALGGGLFGDGLVNALRGVSARTVTLRVGRKLSGRAASWWRMVRRRSK